MSKTRLVVAVALFLSLMSGGGGSGLAQPRIPEAWQAPEIPADLEWLNTPAPLSLRQLRGKVVILDFWTYACINCMHNIPELKRLEKEFPNELVIIGVHSGKYLTERNTNNIRQALLREGIEHPTVNDYRYDVRDQYKVRSWPTTVLVDPAGIVSWGKSGEGVYAAFHDRVKSLVDSFSAKGLLDRKPIETRPERARSTVLSFPGKVLAEQDADRLFIADSNHNRIIISTFDGKILDVAGSGEVGTSEGSFPQAQFNHPQGMAFDRAKNLLYVADTENHMLRRLDLGARTVTTLAGSGEQAREPSPKGIGRNVLLRSPWDLILDGDSLYVAMAGSRQIYLHNLKTGETAPYAGTSREGIVDGPLASAELAQPSGLASDGKKLYVADAESSSVRTVDLQAGGNVGTIVGRDLFEFGDKDGIGDEVRLQHPLGIALTGGELYVADTYNNKIKRVSPGSRSSTTFAGTGAPDLVDGDAAQFDEPGGISASGDMLFVADTNNHVIRTIDLKTKRVSTLALQGVEKLAMTRTSAYRGEVVQLPGRKLAPGKSTLTIDLKLPARHKLNEGAPTSIRVDTGVGQPQQISRPTFPKAVALDLAASGTVQVDLSVYYCEAGKESLCYIKETRLVMPVDVGAGAPSEARIEYAVPTTP